MFGFRFNKVWIDGFMINPINYVVFVVYVQLLVLMPVEISLKFN